VLESAVPLLCEGLAWFRGGGRAGLAAVVGRVALTTQRAQLNGLLGRLAAEYGLATGVHPGYRDT
jgi:hypothetical protein